MSPSLLVNLLAHFLLAASKLSTASVQKRVPADNLQQSCCIPDQEWARRLVCSNHCMCSLEMMVSNVPWTNCLVLRKHQVLHCRCRQYAYGVPAQGAGWRQGEGGSQAGDHGALLLCQGQVCHWQLLLAKISMQSLWWLLDATCQLSSMIGGRRADAVWLPAGLAIP